MITAEEFFRNKIKEKNPNREIVTLSRELITAEEGMRWAYEFKQLDLHAVSESIFDKAVKHVQETYCDVHLSTPYMLLGDVAELIKITTGKEVDLNVLAKYSH